MDIQFRNNRYDSANTVATYEDYQYIALRIQKLNLVGYRRKSMIVDLSDSHQYFYHATSKGEDSKDFILSEEDYYAAFNRFGICACRSTAKILAFSIEDTHVHILIHGNHSECASYISMYEDLTVHYLKEHRQTVKGARLNLKLEPIESERHLMNVGVYTVIQASKDGKRVMPYDYLWGTGCLYFRNSRQLPVWRFDENSVILPIRRISEMTQREMRALFHTKIQIPGDWQICGRFLLPSNYIDVSGFERIYKTPNCFRVFLGMSRTKEEEVMCTTAISFGVQLEDLEAREIFSAMCKEFFGAKGCRNLTVDQRAVLAMECRNRYHMTMRQISSLVKISESEIRRFVK